MGAARRPRGPRGHGQVLRRLDQHPGRLLRLHRTLHAGPGRAALGLPVPAGHPAGHDRGRGHGWPTPWASAAGTPCWAARWAARVPWSGPSRYPDRVRRCAVISVGASSTAEQIAFAQAQTLAIRQDPHFNGGDYYGGPEPEAGLALARRIAHITYRSAAELDGRFGRERPGPGGAAGSRIAGRARALPGGKLPGPPGQQTGPALRREQLHRHHRSAHEPRRLPGPRRPRGGTGSGHRRIPGGGRGLGPPVLPGPVPCAGRGPAGRG